jgi:glyoxylase-like metal-dependent hydrolase (beta-lactamase superfamily II)
MSERPDRLLDGLWRWTARHPEWHPGAFGREVASFALDTGGRGLLVDPLLPPDPAAVLALVDELAAGGADIVITIPYHVRSAEAIAERTGATIWGHPAAANRLADRSRFRELAPGGPAPPGVEAVHVGRPRRFEMPALIASHRAVAFGDAVVEVGGELRIWSQQPVDEGRAAWYRERFVPTLEPLLERDVERVLVTHGEPVLAGGRDALAAALARPPWH